MCDVLFKSIHIYITHAHICIVVRAIYLMCQYIRIVFMGEDELEGNTNWVWGIFLVVGGMRGSVGLVFIGR